MSNPGNKTVLFYALNSVAHTNPLLVMANQLKKDHDYRTVFILLGPPHSDIITKSGHELIIIEEKDVYEDYEIEEGEDPSQLDEERKRREGKRKRPFKGAARWSQFMARHMEEFTGSPEQNLKNIIRLSGSFMSLGLVNNSIELDRAINQLDPDLTICDCFICPAAVVENEHRRPWIRLQSVNPLLIFGPTKGAIKVPYYVSCKLYSRKERDRMRAEKPDRWRSIVAEWDRINNEIGQEYDKYFSKIIQFYKSRGCDRLNSDRQTIDSPHLNIYLFPEALDYGQEDDLLELPPRWMRLETLMHAAPSDFDEDELHRWEDLLNTRAKGKQIIFFSLGTIASGSIKLMSRYLDIISQDEREDRLYVISKGPNGDKLELNQRNMIGANYVPQLALLQRSNLAIIHGGINSVCECLYYGVPMIVLPNFFDQSDNAQRVEDLGLGKQLNIHECTKEELLNAIDELLANMELIERLREIGKKMRECNELDKLSATLKVLVEKGQLDHETALRYNINLG